MSVTELDQFRKRTRWVYYREGVAYGPFSVDEILDMIDEGVLSRDTELMELGSNRRVPLGSVSIFKERAQELDEIMTREMDEAEFEETRQRLGRSRGVQFYLVNIALPVGLILAVALGIFWKQIFNSGSGEEAGAIHVAAEPEDEGKGDGTDKAGAKGPAEAEFVEAESPLEAGLEDYALGLTMEGADDGSIETISAMPTPARAKKLPTVIAVERRKKASPKKPGAKGPGAGGPAAVKDEGIVEMDFSEDEIGAGGADLGSDDVEGMVRQRLQPVLRNCAAKATTEAGTSPDVQARVKVRPTGSLGTLKLTVEPKVGYSEIRMCVIAGMAGIRVPPFEGPARQVTTTN